MRRRNIKRVVVRLDLIRNVFTKVSAPCYTKKDSNTIYNINVYLFHIFVLFDAIEVANYFMPRAKAFGRTETVNDLIRRGELSAINGTVSITPATFRTECFERGRFSTGC